VHPYYSLSGRQSIDGGGAGGGGEPPVPLRRDGQHFIRSDNSAIHKYRGLTAFTALDDWLKGRQDKLIAYAAFTRAMALNTWRIFGVWNNVGLKPEGSYYNEAKALFRWMKEQGIYAHFVCLCDQVDGSSVRLPKAQQVDHLRRMIEIAKDTGTVLLEEFNEFEKNDGDGVCGLLDPSSYGAVMGTRTWWGENANYLQAGSLLAFTNGHTDRGPEHARKAVQSYIVAREGYDYQRPTSGRAPATNRPHILGEPRWIAEGSTPRQHADYAALGTWLAGQGSLIHGTFHTLTGRGDTDLQNCVAPEGGVALECCLAVRDVHLSGLIPADVAALGRFGHGTVDPLTNAPTNPDCPLIHQDRVFQDVWNDYGVLRTYYMEVGGRYYCVPVDPAPNWQPREAPGFTIVAQGGYQGDGKGGNVFVMRRN